MEADRPLTVGYLRTLIADLPDDTPIRTNVIDDENPEYIDHLVVVKAFVDRLTIGWGEPSDLTHEGRPYLLLDTRTSTMAEHREITAPATTDN